MRILSLLLLLLTATPVWTPLVWAQGAGTDAAFNGASKGALGPASPELVLRALYGIGPRANFSHPTLCPRASCRVKLLAADVWQAEDGRERMLLVGAAEPRDAAHAVGAPIGMALLRREARGWVPELGSPVVDVQGAWGEAPSVGIVLAGGFGRGVVATPEISSQGVALTTWSLYVPLGGKFVKVLHLETGQDSLAACERNDAACRRRADVQDFASIVATEPSAGGGVEVTQQISPATASGPPAETRRWVIGKDGRVTQTAGRQPQRRDR